LPESLNCFTRAIAPGIRYRLAASALVAAPSKKHSALVGIRFRDAQGLPTRETPDIFTPSDLFGHYRYLGGPGQKGRIREYLEFIAPPDAVEVEVSLYPWRAGQVSRLDPLSVTPATPQEAEAEMDFRILGDVLGEAEAAVTPGESYDVQVSLSMRQALAARAALCAFRFFDAQGARLPAPEWIPTSPQVGAYRYLTPSPDADPAADVKTGRTSVVPPRGAVSMKVRVIRWKDLPTCTIDTIQIRELATTVPIAAKGSSPLREGSWYALRGRLRATAGRGTTLGHLYLNFLGADGEPILQTAEGLTDTPRGQNQGVVTLPVPERRRKDGLVEVTLGFRPPGGTVAASWRLVPEDGNGWTLTEDEALRLEVFSPDSLFCLSALPAKARHVVGLEPSEGRNLRIQLPQTSLWDTLGRGVMQLAAEWALPQSADSWMRLSADLAHMRDGAVLVPFYFDAEMRPLTGVPVLGARDMPGVGPCRHPVLQTTEDGSTRFSEDLRAPEGAAYLLCYLLVPGDAEQGAVKALGAESISRDAVGEESPIAAMNKVQLLASAEMEDAVWNPLRRRDTYRALSLLEPKSATYRNRFQALSNQVAELDTSWTPPLSARPAYDPDPDAILHLLKVMYPDESSGGAVRSTSILEAQAAQGLKPVACMAMASPLADLPQPDASVPGGMLQRTQNGVSVHHLHFPGLNPARIAPAELLEFETGMHERVARAQRCSLVHAASGFRGYENALKGLAIARCHDLPFVYEVRSFHEHTWQPVEDRGYGNRMTHMRAAQEDRCMAEADVVVTISEAMVENLTARGVPAEKLFFVPNAISETFTTQCDPDAVAALRRKLGIEGRTAIGYISNFSGREGHAVLLDAFARLAREDETLVLVLPGDGPEQAEIARQAHLSGLAERVLLPGNVDHAEIKTWYAMLDLFVVPRIADFASDYVTPLKPYEAMSQGVPVLMSDRPVAREIAGADGERADLFATGDSAALAELIRKRLDEPDLLTRRAAAARDWVLRERVWAEVARRYDEIYATARRVHAARRSKEMS
jgi:glycosyltransferase involved in cell wall biosynthesis